MAPSSLSPVDLHGSTQRAQNRNLTAVYDPEECSWPIGSVHKYQAYLSPPDINGTSRTDNRSTCGQRMLMSIEEINDLLLNFDDGLDSALPSFISGSGQSSSLENGRPDTDSSFTDPIEQLSNLQLELYQCLNVVKAVEKPKKEFMQNIAAKCDRVDTTWSERLFAMTEKFIAALERYAGRAASDKNDTNSREARRQTSRAVQQASPTIVLQESTERMIVSATKTEAFKKMTLQQAS